MDFYFKLKFLIIQLNGYQISIYFDRRNLTLQYVNTAIGFNSKFLLR